MARQWMAVVVVLILGGCRPKSERATAPTLLFTAPAGWTPRPGGTSSYRVPRAEGDAEDGELTVTLGGGPPEKNFAVWARQLDGGRESLVQSRRKLGAWDVTFALGQGALHRWPLPGRPAVDPKPGYAILIAAVGDPPATWYFRLLGPERTVAERTPELEHMIEGAHR